MGENTSIKGAGIQGLDPSYTSLPAAKKKSNEQIGKEEFLTMLVAQLKHQDPMDPMKNEDFAVNLAQFSQLEQLIAIKDTLKSGDGAGGGASLAGYLGQEVVMDSTAVQVKGGDGGKAALELDVDAANVSIELLGADGSVRETVELGAMKAGRHTVSLSELKAQDGEYNMQVKAISTTGMAFTPEAYAAGIVSGFVPGADPVLLVNGKEISLGEIKEVRTPSEDAKA